MKIKATILLLAFFCVRAHAQNYNLTVSHTATYADLTGDVALIYEDSPTYGYYHDLNFRFPAFDKQADFTQNGSIPSRGAYVIPGGYVAVYDATYQSTIVFQVMENDMMDRIPGISRVSAKLEGSTQGSRILKFQWKNIGMMGAAAVRANFQLWLDESDKSISFHYGPSDFSSIDTPRFQVGMLVFSNTTGGLLNLFRLKGDSANPQVATIISTTLPDLKGVPANGTVYTIRPVATGIDQVNEPTAHHAIYPNPVSSSLFIAQLEGTGADIAIYDVCGVLVKHESSYLPTQGLDVSDLRQGIYFVKVNGGIPARFMKVNE